MLLTPTTYDLFYYLFQLAEITGKNEVSNHLLTALINQLSNPSTLTNKFFINKPASRDSLITQ